MPEFIIKDYILAPEDTIVIEYKGKNPFKPVTAVHNIFIDVLQISGSDIFEDHLKWDVTDKSAKSFYGIWRGRRGDDKWTLVWMKIIIQGEVKPDNTGWVKIYIRPWLQTTYEYNNFIQRAFWYFYNRFFYYKIRRAWKEYGEEMAYQIRDKFKQMLGLPIQT
jgi:hypothetical protein